MDKLSFLEKIIKQYVPDLTSDQISQFLTYYEMLIETNKVMNLTAITDFEDVVIKHFADSLSISQIVDLSGNTGNTDKTRSDASDDHEVSSKLINSEETSCTTPDQNSIRILDIGTGAGFPGIPLKIAYPDISITLLDSLNKRVDFLNSVIDELKLNEHGSITAVHSRAEDYIKEAGIRQSYDLAVSRAVASLNVLSEYTLPYVKIGGSFISYKSEQADTEISEAENAISVLGGKIDDKISFTLPESDFGRTLIKITKIKDTPEKYPRKAGIPGKKPLH